MTRLTTADVGALTDRLREFEAGLKEVTGLGLRELAMNTVAHPPVCVPLYGARVAAVPVTSGEGVIGGFSDCVVAILAHLGCEAWVTAQPDVRGIQEAHDEAAEVVFLADDFRFIALNTGNGRCVDDDPATADGYVTALEAAAGSLLGRYVLLLGLGPVGRAAARRLVSRGAAVEVVEPDQARLQAALDVGLKVQPVTLAEGLARCDLIVDATPAAGFIDVAEVSPLTVAAVPGLPSAFTPAAQAALGVRHIHEPLAIGVAVMVARALV
ncbi:MAG: 3-methylornithyl-N6-L-lysine dehydrogenase PylD [Actinobacteria bacterium]|nr:3-methylornithyl-N6-L-lysine dehydrogenase PylD [Actinomycetota bacterium]